RMWAKESAPAVCAAPQELVDRMFPEGLYPENDPNILKFYLDPRLFKKEQCEYGWKAARIGESGKIEIVEAPTGTPMFGMVEEQLLARDPTKTPPPG
ncbi:unnamed protein product, partial [marine sediment metagenome]